MNLSSWRKPRGRRSIFQRAPIAIVGVVVAATLVMPTTVASAQSGSSELVGVEAERLAGADRYETSLRIAEAFAKEAGGTVEHVVLVSGRHWTDAVVAASFASRFGAPLLLTPPGEMRDDALAFLQRVGAEDIHVVAGGESPDTNVTPRVFAELREAGFSVFLSSGADQYAVAVGIARWLDQPGRLSHAGNSAIIANGEVFADALVAGPLSYKSQTAVLLTPRDELHPQVADYLRDADIAHVVLMGGTAALSADVEAAIKALGITDVDRIAGATRFETATMTARYAAQQYALASGGAAGCFGGSSIGLARARIPFDSLGAAPLLAQRCAPLVLTDPAEVPPSTAEYLDTVRRNASKNIDLTVFGGNAAVSQQALDGYLQTAAPEPESADVTCGFEYGDSAVRLLEGLNVSSPSWSPDCSRIVYVDRGNIWTSRIDGSGRTQLTSGAKIDDGDGTWSSDSSRLTLDDQEDSSPIWSPDGTRIAFSRYAGVWIHGDDPQSFIFMVDVDGSSLTQLTESIAYDTQPRWSPDGTRIAFDRRNLDADPGDFDGGWKDDYIALVDIASREVTELLRSGPSETNSNWTADSRHLSHSLHGGATPAIMRADGTEQRQLPFQATGRLEWSPDGNSVSFARRERLDDGRITYHLMIAAADGSDAQSAVSYSGIREEHLVIAVLQWAPDGQGVIFERVKNTGGPRQVFLIATPR